MSTNVKKKRSELYLKFVFDLHYLFPFLRNLCHFLRTLDGPIERTILVFFIVFYFHTK